MNGHKVEWEFRSILADHRRESMTGDRRKTAILDLMVRGRRDFELLNVRCRQCGSYFSQEMVSGARRYVESQGPEAVEAMAKRVFRELGDHRTCDEVYRDRLAREVMET